MRILNRFTGEVLLETQGADLQGADLRSADLQGADLQGANLCGADLRSADLCGADLRGADLQGADLWRAYLQGADLRRADLRDADLQGADLRSADLRSVNLQGTGAVVLYGLRWPVIIVPGNMRIGCQAHAAEAWENFTDKAIDDMDSNASVFWAEHKEMLLKLAKRADTFIKEK